MKTKLTIITALCAFFSNAFLFGSGNLSVGYTSDYVRRGALVSEEALQARANYLSSAGPLVFGGSIGSNQPTGEGEDSYLISGGAEAEIAGLFSLYVGLEHFETLDQESVLDVVADIGLDSVLNPSLYIARNTDDELYTVEASVFHVVSLQAVDVELGALYGYTDVTETVDEDYWVLSAATSVAVSESADIRLTYDYVESDLSAEDNIFGAALSVSF